MDENFFQNFFLLGMYCTNEHALYRKVENFFRNLFEELFEVESKQKPAPGVGVT